MLASSNKQMPAKPQPIAAITKLMTTGRPRIVPRSKAGQGKKARADNRTYAEGNQVARAERAVKLHPLRIVIAPGNLFALK